NWVSAEHQHSQPAWGAVSSVPSAGLCGKNISYFRLQKGYCYGNAGSQTILPYYLETHTDEPVIGFRWPSGSCGRLRQLPCTVTGIVNESGGKSAQMDKKGKMGKWLPSAGEVEVEEPIQFAFSFVPGISPSMRPV